MLRMEYTHTANDLPSQIVEKDQLNPVGVWSTRATTTFTYDRRGRLTAEQRSPQNAYQRVYVYDKGGNRLSMEAQDDVNGHRRVNYHYDVHWADERGPRQNPYGSFNNRLEWSETLDISGAPPYPTLSTTWYYYSAAGNVTRVVSDPPQRGGGQYEAGTAIGTVGTTVNGSVEATSLVEGGGDSSMALVGGGTGCPTGTNQYTTTRFEYAKNGETVAYALGEQWCWDGGSTCPSITNYTINWAREFRYDGARARYMNAPLDPVTLTPYNTTEKPTVWSDYDGDEAYGDFTVSTANPPVVSNLRSFEPGIARTENPLTSPLTNYYHGDMLGTTRLMSNSSGSSIEPAVYTAFGERISAPTITDATRYGYVGAWGYQAHADFPFLHVGERYFDPASGRFLQRDPIGLAGALNVYAYALNNPTVYFDPDGLTIMEGVAECFLWCTGGQGHVPVLDPGPAQDVVQTVAEIVSVAAPVGAVGGTIAAGGKTVRALKNTCIGRQIQKIRKYIRYDRAHHNKPPGWDGELIHPKPPKPTPKPKPGAPMG